MPNVKNTDKDTKYIFITGGVLSSLGKGIASSSLSLILKQMGYSVTIMKLDPYINVDPGTMNPFQHGEVFVTDDGAETDLDLGHYERFLGNSLNKNNNHTTGQVYFEVITKERRGLYLGNTVQVIPHITDEIKKRIKVFHNQFDFVLVEIGGTVGDIESLPFLEAQRQMNLELGWRHIINLHLTYVPYIKSAGELKTKPTQHSVQTLMEYGVRPDVLLCRSESKIPKDVKKKIALFCSVEENSVIDVPDVEHSIYEVPNVLAKRKLAEIIHKKFDMEVPNLDFEVWTKFVNRIKNPKKEVKVALVGKYTQYRDSYKSILEAFVHAGSVNNTRVNVELINSEELTAENVASTLEGIEGVLVGPGFGNRGIDGKIETIKYLRENKIPYFGICLGMQCAVIEFARNVCGIAEANSSEFVENDYSVIDLMNTQKDITSKGGTMRLGSYPCILKPDSIVANAYGSLEINERHRHRYEFNNEFREQLTGAGLILSGVSPDDTLVEIIELKDHPWFVGVQFHPELKSRAVTGHPLFISFIKAVLDNKK